MLNVAKYTLYAIDKNRKKKYLILFPKHLEILSSAVTTMEVGNHGTSYLVLLLADHRLGSGLRDVRNGPQPEHVRHVR